MKCVCKNSKRKTGRWKVMTGNAKNFIRTENKLQVKKDVTGKHKSNWEDQ